MQFLVTFTTINRIEIIIGKLSTAIKILLLFAFAAIPDNNERDAEKPIAPSISSKANKPMSATGLCNNVMNNTNPVIESSNDSKKL
jgi:hypothetical protein